MKLEQYAHLDNTLVKTAAHMLLGMHLSVRPGLKIQIIMFMCVFVFERANFEFRCNYQVLLLI